MDVPFHPWIEKLERQQGLCVSVGRTDDENAQVICTIVNLYAAGVPLQWAGRTVDNWQEVIDLPTMFELRYRVAQ